MSKHNVHNHDLRCVPCDHPGTALCTFTTWNYYSMFLQSCRLGFNKDCKCEYLLYRSSHIYPHPLQAQQLAIEHLRVVKLALEYIVRVT